MSKIDITNPNEVAAALLSAAPFGGRGIDLRVVVPADLHMTMAECVAELLEVDNDTPNT